MAHQSKADTIEARIKSDRAALASTLGTLQDRMSVENLAQDALGIIRTNTAPFTRSIDKAVRANPLALAVTGVGIAWLIFGRGKSAAKELPRKSLARWEDEGGNVLPVDDDADATPQAAADLGWLRDLDSLRESASDRLREIEQQVRAATDTVRTGATDTFDKARDFAAERAAVLAEFVEDMKCGLAEGLDGLSDTARDKVVAVRERAYAARIRTAGALQGHTRSAGRLIEDHPMVAGVIALALGAAFAAALPRTRGEDRAFGPERDRLMNEASRLVRQERGRAARVASGVAKEMKRSSKAVSQTRSDPVTDTTGTLKKPARTNGAGKKPKTPGSGDLQT